MRIPIGNVDTPDELITAAFNKARKTTDRARGTFRGKGLTRLLKSRALEMMKIVVATDTLTGKLDALVKAFPHITNLPAFYQELVRCTLDQDLYKKALGAADWASGQIKKIAKVSRDKLRNARELAQITAARNAFYGRAASVLKQIRKDLAYLEECRKTLKEFPTIKTDLSTVVIAGYPNVGKSTLLKALTGAAPKIAPYPFTTKQLMLGYTKDIQFIDTPGLLDRPFAKRNPIERQAILALKHLATLILFVIDPTESCGYGLREQAELLQQVQTLFKTPMLIVLTKMDVASTDQVADARSIAGKDNLEVDTTERASVERLLSAIERSVHAARTAS